jgi:hypothetical protein
MLASRAMSRSAIVMVVAGAILLGVLAVVTQHYWPVLALQSTLFKLIVIGIGVYGALLTAVMIRRIAEPSLPMPILAWVVAIVWFVVGLIGAAKTDPDDRRHELHRTEPETSSSFGKQGTGMGWAIFLTIVGLGMYAAGLGLTYWKGKHTLEAPPPTTAQTKPAAPSTPEPKPAAPATIFDQPTLAKAVDFARAELTDTRDAPSQGAKLLAKYIAVKSKWAELAVAKNETSLEVVEKNPMAQLGKRVCVSGALAKLEAQNLDGLELHVGRINIANGDGIEMYAVGKTGTLARRKPAKFCGVVTGRYDGGGAPATFAVGMFDTNK